MLLAVTIVLIILAVLLILVVLIQDSKGGLAAGTNATQIMGVRKTGDIMEKLTWGFGIGIMVLCVTAGLLRGPAEEAPADEAPVQQSAPAPAPKAAAPAAVDSSVPAEAQPATDTSKK
ncbi:MAG: preprotein translocase subunit SecG [Bacteroidota bacterium]